MGETENRNYLNNGYDRAKLIETWDPRAVAVHIWDNFNVVAFKIILVSFGALTIFTKLRLPNSTSSTNHNQTFIKESCNISSVVITIQRLRF